MKLVKLTMLAATAAVAASAFIGASSASAVTSHTVIQLCDEAVLVLCPVEHLLRSNHDLKESKLILLTGAGEFKAGLVIVKCTSGEGETQVVGENEGMENSFKATLAKLTFAGCTGCTGVEVTVPQVTTLSMTTELGEGWTISAPNSEVKFTGCPFGQSCTYKGNLTFNVKMDTEGAFADPESKEFTITKELPEKKLCAITGKWENGRTRVDLKLGDLKKSIHKNVTPTLLEVLDTVAAREL